MHMQSTEAVDDFFGAAAQHQICEDLFVEHLKRAAQHAKMTPAALLLEVKRRVATHHYNDVMLGSLPQWIRPLFGLEATPALV
jgi:hypothetical protein